MVGSLPLPRAALRRALPDAVRSVLGPPGLPGCVGDGQRRAAREGYSRAREFTRAGASLAALEPAPRTVPGLRALGMAGPGREFTPWVLPPRPAAAASAAALPWPRATAPRPGEAGPSSPSGTCSVSQPCIAQKWRLWQRLSVFPVPFSPSQGLVKENVARRASSAPPLAPHGGEPWPGAGGAPGPAPGRPAAGRIQRRYRTAGRAKSVFLRWRSSSRPGFRTIRQASLNVFT